MEVYVFRINYDDQFGKIRRELLDGRLRQGWGAPGMTVAGTIEEFSDAWKVAWEEDEYDIMRKKYHNIHVMTEMQEGDLIVIPKISMQEEFVCRSFMVVKCKAGYKFEIPAYWKDFGHCVEVEPLFSCPYDANDESRTISAKFKAYQSPINRVYNSAFINAVEALIQLQKENPADFEKTDAALLYHLANGTKNARQSYLKSVVEKMQDWSDRNFENIISELFEKNGYEKLGNNLYDRKGGDIDIVFSCFPRNSLMDNIASITSKDIVPNIYVQAKKKRGKDVGDINGVNELIKMREYKSINKNSICILINLTEEFTPEARKLADNHNVILINGIQFASLLVRYGIGTDCI